MIVSRGERGVGDFGVLVETVGRIGVVRVALGRCLAIADVVEIVSVTVVGINSGDGVCQLATIVVGVGKQQSHAVVVN